MNAQGRKAVQLEQSLNEERSAYFEQADSAYLVLEPDHSVIDSNQNGRRLLGGRALSQDSMGRICVMGDRGSSRLGQHMDQALSTGSARALFPLTPGTWLEMELSRLKLDGRERVLASPRVISLDAVPNIGAVARLFGLTPAEHSVLEGIAEAQRPKQIARDLNISVHTVRAHIRSIYGKMGVNSSIGAQKVITMLEKLTAGLAY